MAMLLHALWNLFCGGFAVGTGVLANFAKFISRRFKRASLDSGTVAGKALRCKMYVIASQMLSDSSTVRKANPSRAGYVKVLVSLVRSF